MGTTSGHQCDCRDQPLSPHVRALTAVILVVTLGACGVEDETRVEPRQAATGDARSVTTSSLAAAADESADASSVDKFVEQIRALPAWQTVRLPHAGLGVYAAESTLVVVGNVTGVAGLASRVLTADELGAGGAVEGSISVVSIMVSIEVDPASSSAIDDLPKEVRAPIALWATGVFDDFDAFAADLAEQVRQALPVGAPVAILSNGIKDGNLSTPTNGVIPALAAWCFVEPDGSLVSADPTIDKNGLTGLDLASIVSSVGG